MVNVNNHRVNCFCIQSSSGTCSVPMRNNTDQKNSKYGVYSSCHNNLAIYCVARQVRFTTSKTGLFIYYNRPNVRIALCVPEKLKT